MMLSRSISATARSAINQRGIFLGVTNYEDLLSKRRYCLLRNQDKSAIHNLKSIENTVGHSQICFKKQPFSLCCQRHFSTTTPTLSISDKVGKLYMKRDLWTLKRKQFFQKFAASRFVNAAPESWKPYLELARVDKPIGTWLLYLPCAFGICLATPAGSLPNLYYLGLFGVGAFLMRGAGCVINDLWDQDLDKHVERTKVRPLASEKLKTKNAIAMLAVQLSLSLGILLSLNTTCIAIGVASMIPVILYPLSKRVTYFPQAVLGLTFNVGAIMGYAAVAGHIDLSIVLPLYLGCFIWTLYYDTLYAVQDAADDLKIGVKSTALLFLASGDVEALKKLPVAERLMVMSNSMRTLQRGLAVCYGSTMVCMMVAMYGAGCGLPAFGVPLLHLLKCHPSEHQVCTPKVCGESFMESKNTGIGILISIIVGMYFTHP